MLHYYLSNCGNLSGIKIQVYYYTFFESVWSRCPLITGSMSCICLVNGSNDSLITQPSEKEKKKAILLAQLRRKPDMTLTAIVYLSH